MKRVKTAKIADKENTTFRELWFIINMTHESKR